MRWWPRSGGALYAGAVPTIFPYPDATGSGEARQQRLVALAAFTDAQAVLCPPTAQADVAHWFDGQATRALALAGETEPLAEALLSPRSGEEIAYIQFSSGSTGTPKGVMLSHRAVLTHGQAFGAALRFSEQDVSVSWLPFFHDMGLVTALLLPLLTGAVSVTMPPPLWLRRPQLLFRAIDRYRGTMTWMPNFAFNHCLRMMRDEQLAGLDLSSWRILGNGSEPVQPAMLQRFAERFAPWRLHPQALTVGYGMAENVVDITLTPIDQLSKAD
ncbi:AMP-binding protein [Candidatus Chloroploca sp. M-50]|uniref:AMP-binding protein n=1 Tax=Candidatus Chloroploca mongolica TaxID=2528176 RepID=A0ABS4D478_9CHLR|nr:AMP-binding protein [Candidatus Chloroploca mongolica]